jgi:hypothetical protein
MSASVRGVLGWVCLWGCGDAGLGFVDGPEAGDGRAGDGARIARAEECNGLDDDVDGDVDEECDCEVGATQACWPGDPAHAGVGACAMGEQTCGSAFEFGTWGECAGATLPDTRETCGNDLDDDCNGAADDGCPGQGDDEGDDGLGGGDADADGSDDDDGDGGRGGRVPDGDCADGDRRDCFEGDAEQEGVGVCRAGEQACEGGAWGPCLGAGEPELEACGDGLDNDCDGELDEGCECAPGDVQPCFDGAGDQEGVGICHAGRQECLDGAWGPCEGAQLPEEEGCNDGIDADCDGDLGDGCTCRPGETRECYGGDDPDQIGVGRCRAGLETCEEGADDNSWGVCEGDRLPREETCGDDVDQDCDGEDAVCEILVLDLWINGDCVWASCPVTHPYPVGCNIDFVGGDDRGCVAHQDGSSAVYFQEGDDCGAGFLSGTLSCSNGPGDPLNALNCPINKEEPYYHADANSCPD